MPWRYPVAPYSLRAVPRTKMKLLPRFTCVCVCVWCSQAPLPLRRLMFGLLSVVGMGCMWMFTTCDITAAPEEDLCGAFRKCYSMAL